jgi:Ca-activated chloride channel family protein
MKRLEHIRAALDDAAARRRGKGVTPGLPHAAVFLLLSLIVIVPAGYAQAAEPNEIDIDATYFHPAASMYIHGDSAGASNLVAQGLALFPDDGKLLRLKELLEQQNEQQNQQQNQDQNQEQNQQPQEEEQEQQDQEQEDQQTPRDQNQDRNQQPQPEPSSAEEMTEDEAEQLLDAMRQEEQNKRLQLHPVMGAPVEVDKDW